MIYIIRDNIETAHENLLPSLEIDFSYPRIYIGLLLTTVHLDHWADALEFANRGLELDPNSSEYFYARGYQYSDFDTFEQAIADMQTVIDMTTSASRKRIAEQNLLPPLD